MGEDEEGLAADDDHKDADIELFVVDQARILDIFLNDQASQLFHEDVQVGFLLRGSVYFRIFGSFSLLLLGRLLFSLL